MALKFELEQWQDACTAFDSKDYDSALKAFINMADNAKMHFNIGLIFAAVDDHERALAAYGRSIAMDPYFAVAYFQKGVSHFCIGNMQEAMQEFDHAYTKLRGNQIINYQQLGLAFRLYACEVLFNRGICRLYLGKIDAGLTDLYHAQKSKMTEEHDVIDQAVRDRGKGYSVFSIPVGVLYRPPESRLRQMHTGGIDMFAAVDKLGLNKFQPKPIITNNGNNEQQQHLQPVGISRNNSVLLSSTKFQRKQSLGFSSLGKQLRYTTSQQPSLSSSPGTPPLLDPIPVTSISSQYPRNQHQNHQHHLQQQHQHQQYPYQSSSNGSNNNIPLSSSSSSYQQYSPTERSRKDSNPPFPPYAHDEWADSISQPSSSTSSFTSSLRYRADSNGNGHNSNSNGNNGRRVDSGFESSHEDRFSFSSRNSAKSHKTNRYSPPPVPPIPKSTSSTTTFTNHYDDVFDPMSYSQFDSTNTTTTTTAGDLSAEFQHMTVKEERDRIRGRLNSNGMEESDFLRRAGYDRNRSPQPQPSTSSSTTHSRDMLQHQQGSKIKIKVHHTDTRVLLVPSSITFDDLIARVREKLNAPAHTRLQYKDEDNEMVLMIDDDDLQMARQIHKLRSNHELGVEKMEIWCIT